jgi:hypothetical protein
MTVTQGQMEYEWRHLKGKLKHRSPEVYRQACKIKSPESHPMFLVGAGDKETWEK